MKSIMKSIAKYVPIFSVVAAVLIVFSSGPATAQAGQLYAGTSNPGIVYAYDGSSWTAISASLGFAVLDLIEFQGDLYVATMSSRYSGDGLVYRYDGGENWTPPFTHDGSAGLRPSGMERCSLCRHRLEWRQSVPLQPRHREF